MSSCNRVREKPHGIDYSLTLHGPDGERLVGFDNAHPAPAGKRGEPLNHRHRLRTVKPYDCQDAETLLADFCPSWSRYCAKEE
jgi:Family of unknown function (DUF6516)